MGEHFDAEWGDMLDAQPQEEEQEAPTRIRNEQGKRKRPREPREPKPDGGRGGKRQMTGQQPLIAAVISGCSGGASQISTADNDAELLGFIAGCKESNGVDTPMDDVEAPTASHSYANASADGEGDWEDDLFNAPASRPIDHAQMMYDTQETTQTTQTQIVYDTPEVVQEPLIFEPQPQPEPESFGQPLMPMEVEEDESPEEEKQIEEEEPQNESTWNDSNINSTETLFYWLDAREVHSRPGEVFLFGKTREAPAGEVVSYPSACIRVMNIPRCVFVLGREGSTDQQVKDDISVLCQQKQIKERTLKRVNRWYAFEEPGVPHGRATYWKLTYSAAHPPLDAKPTAHIQQIFHANRSVLELLLLKRNIMGPCWLKITNAREHEAGKYAHTKKEFEIGDEIKMSGFAKSVKGHKLVRAFREGEQAPPSPPLCVMSVQLRTCIRKSERGAYTNEVWGIVARAQTRVDPENGKFQGQEKVWAAVRRRSPEALLPLRFDRNLPSGRIQEFNTEADLLKNFLKVLEREDPDVLVGHNFVEYDLDVLLHRMGTLGINDWSKLGRLVLKQLPKMQTGVAGHGTSTWEEKMITGGRLVADTYRLAQEYLPRETDLRLVVIASRQGIPSAKKHLQDAMNATKEENQQEEGVPAEFTSQDGVALRRQVDLLLDKSKMSLELVNKLQAIPLTFTLTKLAGNLWSRTLTGNRAERIEYLLLHKFHQSKFIEPDRPKKED